MTMRSPDVANVFWESEETLRCLECSGPILPRYTSDGEVVYQIWYSSNEDCGVNFLEISREKLPSFSFYKFCAEACCTKWAHARGSSADFDAVAEQSYALAQALQPKRFVLGGLFLGMPIRNAVAIVNSATGRRFRPRETEGRLIFTSSSSIDYPSNEASMRSSAGGDAPLRELRLSAGMLSNVLSKFEGGEVSPESLRGYMERRIKFSPLPADSRLKCRWLVSCPEPGTRLYLLPEDPPEWVVAPPAGSIIWVKL